MNLPKKKQIFEDLKIRLGYDSEQVKEIIQEVRYKILEHLDGSVEYSSIDEIMQDFLGFSDEYLDAIFSLV